MSHGSLLKNIFNYIHEADQDGAFEQQTDGQGAHLLAWIHSSSPHSLGGGWRRRGSVEQSKML